MRIDPWIAEGTVNREWVEFAIEVDKLKRELLRAFKVERGTPMQGRKAKR